jgi:hypothetical protein
MLGKTKDYLDIIQKGLFMIIVVLFGFMLSIRYVNHRNIKNISHLDKSIEKLEKERELLNLELVYLTSPVRLLVMVEKNPAILRNKKMVSSSQIKNKRELTKISLAKMKEQMSKNRFASLLDAVERGL